jgi:hypothetical protein
VENLLVVPGNVSPESRARLAMGPLAEISVVVLLVGLTWFLVAV